jgi:riboflavin kinase/FMN adenylyltransferase
MEVNIFDFDSDIYNQKLILKFWHFLRKELRFANSTELIKQIDSDKEGVLAFFSNQ